MRTPRLFAVLAAGWLVSAACATAPPQFHLLKKEGAASVWLSPSLDNPPTLTMRDEATIKLRVEGPASLEVEPLDQAKAVLQWSLEPQGKPVQRAAEGKGKAVWEQEYLLQPGQPGEHAVELPPLRYRFGEGDWREVRWPPLKLHITGTLKKADPALAREPTGIEDVPEAPPGRGWLLWAGVGLGVLLLGVTALVVTRRRAVKQPPLQPHQWALRELEQLATWRPQSGAEVEAYHTALSMVLRRYLERRFQIPAERQTTAEFVEAVRKSSELSAEQQATLQELLTQCDLAKFARVWPAAEECQALVARARAFVEETAPKPDGA